MIIPVAGAASAGDDPELRSYKEATAKMSKSAKPTVGTLRRWYKAHKAMCSTRHLPGRKDKTTTLNSLVPGTSFSTAQK